MLALRGYGPDRVAVEQERDVVEVRAEGGSTAPYVASSPIGELATGLFRIAAAPRLVADRELEGRGADGFEAREAGGAELGEQALEGGELGLAVPALLARQEGLARGERTAVVGAMHGHGGLEEE